jgi:hypothetical protein
VKKRKNLGFSLLLLGYKLNLWFSSSGAFGLVVNGVKIGVDGDKTRKLRGLIR